MADSTTRRLIELIGKTDQRDLRRAALLVAGEVGSAREERLVEALLQVVDDGDPELRSQAIDALGKLRVERALSRIIQRVRDGDAHVIESVARAAGGMGAKGARALEKLLAEAHPFLRRRIAAALTLAGTESAAVAGAHALLDADPGVVEAAAKSLAGEAPTLSDGQRRSLASHLIAALQQKRKPPLAAVAEAAMLRVLAALNHPKAEELFWKCTEPVHAPTVRSTALQALGTLPPAKGEVKVKRLIACAVEPTFQVAAPALMLLKQAVIEPKQAKALLPLLDAPDAAVRRFAVERLKDSSDAAVLKGLVAQLRAHERDLQDAAFDALSQSPRGRLALVEALRDAANPDEAWALARSEARFAKELPTAARTLLFTQACRYRDKEDRRSDALFFFLREVDAAWTHEQLEARGLELRKKKDYAGAVNYLKMLVRDPKCGEETRFELACAGLKTSAKDVAPEARQNDPTLGQFGRLLQGSNFDLVPRLKKLKWLEPADLFYLGFHFVEHQGKDQQFGADVLLMLVQRSPKSQLAKDAKRKLKSEGMG